MSWNHVWTRVTFWDACCFSDAYDKINRNASENASESEHTLDENENAYIGLHLHMGGEIPARDRTVCDFSLRTPRPTARTRNNNNSSSLIILINRISNITNENMTKFIAAIATLLAVGVCKAADHQPPSLRGRFLAGNTTCMGSPCSCTESCVCMERELYESYLRDFAALGI